MSARKSRRSRTTRRRKLAPAYPPPDNPLLRHEELTIDHRIEGEKKIVPSASLMMAMATATGKKPRAAAAPRTTAKSTKTRLANLRLAALAQARTLDHHTTGGATYARSRALSDAAPAGVEMVPATGGASNWVQLGPTASPTARRTAARVLVTGRVTAIVVDPDSTNTIYIGTAQGGVWKTTDGGLRGCRRRTTKCRSRSAASRWIPPITWCCTRERAKATSPETATTATAF